MHKMSRTIFLWLSFLSVFSCHTTDLVRQLNPEQLIKSIGRSIANFDYTDSVAEIDLPGNLQYVIDFGFSRSGFVFAGEFPRASGYIRSKTFALELGKAAAQSISLLTGQDSIDRRKRLQGEVGLEGISLGAGLEFLKNREFNPWVIYAFKVFLLLKHYQEKGEGFAFLEDERKIASRELLMTRNGLLSEYFRLSFRLFWTLKKRGMEIDHNDILKDSTIILPVLQELSRLLGQDEDFLPNQIRDTWRALWRYQEITFAESGLYGIGPAVYMTLYDSKEMADLLVSILSKNKNRSELKRGGDYTQMLSDILYVEIENATGEQARKLENLRDETIVEYLGLVDENAPGDIPDIIRQKAGSLKTSNRLETIDEVREVDGKYVVAYYTGKLNMAETLRMVATIALKAAIDYMELLEKQQGRENLLNELETMTSYEQTETEFLETDAGRVSRENVEDAINKLYERKVVEKEVLEEEKPEEIKILEKQIQKRSQEIKVRKKIENILLVQVVQYLLGYDVDGDRSKKPQQVLDDVVKNFNEALRKKNISFNFKTGVESFFDRTKERWEEKIRETIQDYLKGAPISRKDILARAAKQMKEVVGRVHSVFGGPRVLQAGEIFQDKDLTYIASQLQWYHLRDENYPQSDKNMILDRVREIGVTAGAQVDLGLEAVSRALLRQKKLEYATTWQTMRDDVRDLPSYKDLIKELKKKGYSFDEERDRIVKLEGKPEREEGIVERTVGKVKGVISGIGEKPVNRIVSHLKRIDELKVEIRELKIKLKDAQEKGRSTYAFEKSIRDKSQEIIKKAQSSAKTLQELLRRERSIYYNEVEKLELRRERIEARVSRTTGERQERAEQELEHVRARIYLLHRRKNSVDTDYESLEEERRLPIESIEDAFALTEVITNILQMRDIDTGVQGDNKLAKWYDSFKEFQNKIRSSPGFIKIEENVKARLKAVFKNSLSFRDYSALYILVITSFVPMIKFSAKELADLQRLSAV